MSGRPRLGDFLAIMSVTMNNSLVLRGDLNRRT